ncbi:hypothetical protein VaNZ11_014068 [Volvox africanus]|uniref:Uncharacterized protein n=1 Tax=Volvox africanus TaxID=51714 RepID=A0ABQ5SIT9_9CHLO|nr:hypothetical protein VaNZ11_014068 [Volvox africanus]
MALDTTGTSPGHIAPGNAHAAEADPAEQTAIEEASVIHLLRVLVSEAAPPAKASEDAMDHQSSTAGPAEDVNDITCEEAGCLLWDMSASRPVARVMLRNRALEALEIVIARELQIVQDADVSEAGLLPGVGDTVTPAAGWSSPEDRQAAQQQQQRRPNQNALRILEVCLGTLANLVVTQSSAAVEVSSRSEFLALLLTPRNPEDDNPNDIVPPPGGGALYVDDARVLSELFRLVSVALRCQGFHVWLRAFSSPAVLQRVMWVGAATADTQLFARFLDMLVALLHAASGSLATVETGSGRGATSGGDVVATVAADPNGAAQSGAGRACCRVLMECGLMGLLHQVLLQALRTCMPAEEKYSELGGADGEVFVSTLDSDRQTVASPPSVASGPAAGLLGRPTSAVAAAERGSDAIPAAAAEITPWSDGSSRFNQPGGVATSVPYARPEDAFHVVPSDGGGPSSPIHDSGTIAAAAMAAVTAAAAATGPVPLSDDAVDAALRLIEELVSPNGPLVAPGEGSESAWGRDGTGVAASGSSGAEVLLQLHAEKGLRPGLLQLLLGLLRYQYDSMQVVEGLLVVLVDLGSAVQGSVAASPPETAVAVAARLVELLQDSCFSPTDGTPSSIIQLQQGAWYLLAATLRGALLAVAAGADTVEPPSSAAAFKRTVRETELAGMSTQVRAEVPSATATMAVWRANWSSLERSLSALPALPRPDGCLGYSRACFVAGMGLLDELWGPQLEAAAAGEKGSGDGASGDEQGRQRDKRPRHSSCARTPTAGDTGSPLHRAGEEVSGFGNGESLMRLGAQLQRMLNSLEGHAC